MIVTLDDPADARVSEYTSLTDVALRTKVEPEQGLYLAESSNVIRRAVAAGHRPRSFLMAPRWLESMRDVLSEVGGDPDGGSVPVYVAPEDVLESLTGFHLHRGALASMYRPTLPSLESVLEGARRVVILEDLVDHTNVGACVRSAAALGIDAILVTPSCADPLYRRAVRVSMGTIFQVPWTRIAPWPESISSLRELGFEVAALALSDDSVALDAYAASLGPDSRVALVLGAEGDGLSRRTIAACDRVVRIPMAGVVDSLNVAAAGAVAFWELRDRGSNAMSRSVETKVT